ncbi:MAG: Fn3-like domain-containing protein [Algibacter sp.]|uniref:Fn3-like domain-containing protein n=1 Tax=Algibacter sp. TaxID=1872428 RepID=UPI003297CC8A
MKALYILIFTIFIGGTTIEKNSSSINDLNCSATLKVQKDRSFKSATENGAQFILTLTNTSGKPASYKLTASKSLNPCTNNKSTNMSKSAVRNSDLYISLNQNTAYSSTSENSAISLENGESKEFKVSVTVPEGTEYKTWGCIEVKANALNCNSVSAEIILSVYIPDPTEG